MNDKLPSLRDQARAATTTIIVTTGRQVPTALEDTAVQLLAALWAVGLTYGVQPADWRASAGLPAACIDVLVLVEARRRSSP